MVWDPSFQSWIDLGITGQPQGRLLTGGGELVASWSGAIPEGDVLDLVDTL